jgi:ArsR family transcriptional regulator
MLTAARARLENGPRAASVPSSAAMHFNNNLHFNNSVELRQGALEELPVADGELDAAVLMLVLHHLADPAAVLAEAARALAPGGRLLLVDMLAHDRVRFREEMGHQWLGFEPERVESWLADAGFAAARLAPLPADPEARGPGLFAATASRPRAERDVNDFSPTDERTTTERSVGASR